MIGVLRQLVSSERREQLPAAEPHDLPANSIGSCQE